jgi:hypothetical protein
MPSVQTSDLEAFYRLLLDFSARSTLDIVAGSQYPHDRGQSVVWTYSSLYVYHTALAYSPSLILPADSISGSFDYGCNPLNPLLPTWIHTCTLFITTVASPDVYYCF